MYVVPRQTVVRQLGHAVVRPNTLVEAVHEAEREDISSLYFQVASCSSHGEHFWVNARYRGCC